MFQTASTISVEPSSALTLTAVPTGSSGPETRRHPYRRLSYFLLGVAPGGASVGWPSDVEAHDADVLEFGFERVAGLEALLVAGGVGVAGGDEVTGEERAHA